MANDPARYKDTMPSMTGYDYKLGRKGGSNTTDYNNSGSGYCIMCHGGQKLTNTASFLDMGTAGDGGSPSCSGSQGPIGNNSNYPGCHGSTNITGSSMENVTWKGRSQTPGNSKSHNHSSSIKGAPCELCHAGGGTPGTGTGGMHMVAGLPNLTTTDYTNINTQCVLCHNITGGLNITSNGGINVPHNDPDCKACHLDSDGKLDSHLVPTAGIPNANCTECHDLGGRSLLHIDFDTFNNSDYVHNQYNVSKGLYPLNYNASSGSAVRASENKICWACHGNDTNNDGKADFSE